ncbi:MAG: hypothetical protein NT157_00675 [Candidatus Micrarchaeota archaeon]|nr:hypothetical protein [Candidatus Micrarchaeota archaeon]
MLKALVFIHGERVPVRSIRYPHINLSGSTTVFPISARKYLSQFEKARTLETDFGEKELAGADLRWLAGRPLMLHFLGEKYSTRLLSELELLEEWKSAGVSEEEDEEYSYRVLNLRKKIAELTPRTFVSKTKEDLSSRVNRLGSFSPSESNSNFEKKQSNLKRITSAGQEIFKERVLELLIRPMDGEELASALGLTHSTTMKRLRSLFRSGLVKRTTQRLPLGRPKVVYYLSGRI